MGADLVVGVGVVGAVVVVGAGVVGTEVEGMGAVRSFWIVVVVEVVSTGVVGAAVVVRAKLGMGVVGSSVIVMSSVFVSSDAVKPSVLSGLSVEVLPSVEEYSHSVVGSSLESAVCCGAPD